MVDRVLVPLDGSPTAETILPFAEAVAGPLGAEMTLLRVVEPPSTLEAIAAGGVLIPSEVELRELEARNYLAEVEARLTRKGLRVRTRLEAGLPREKILTAAQEIGADLIAMATHGRSGVRRALLGSVAEAVLRHAPVPLLLVAAPAGNIRPAAGPESPEPHAP